MSESVQIGPPQEWQEPAPEVGGLDFLVYGECGCGWRCACTEGARWPKCPLCGEQVMPPPADGDKPRLGYVARLLPEQEAVAEVRGYVSGGR
jgi:hypothetical protein